MTSRSYQTLDRTLLLEIQEAAERRLEAQLTAALAADQRALVFAGFLAAASLAVAGAGASALTGVPADPFLGRLAMGVTVGLLGAMALAIWAAQPAAWYYPGGRPESWLDDIEGHVPQLQRLVALAADYDDRLAANDRLMAGNARLLLASAATTFVTLALGVGAFALKLLAMGGFRYLVAAAFCFAALIVRWLCAGPGGGALESVRQPRCTPPARLWRAAGIVWYAIPFFALSRLLPLWPASGWAVALLAGLMGVNAAASGLSLRASRLDLAFLLFVAHAALLVAFLAVACRLDAPICVLFVLHALYQPYAGYWAWQLWKLNAPASAGSAEPGAAA